MIVTYDMRILHRKEGRSSKTLRLYIPPSYTDLLFIALGTQTTIQHILQAIILPTTQ